MKFYLRHTVTFCIWHSIIEPDLFFWHAIWHFIWHFYLAYFQHSIWHSIWHSTYLTHFLTESWRVRHRVRVRKPSESSPWCAWNLETGRKGETKTSGKNLFQTEFHNKMKNPGPLKSWEGTALQCKNHVAPRPRTVGSLCSQQLFLPWVPSK